MRRHPGRTVLWLALSLAVLVSSAHAAPAPVVVETAFHNQNWFPLPVSDMRAAAVDTALATLTSRADLALVEEASAGDAAVGRVRFDVSLIEKAESIKLRIELTHGNGSTWVATASDSVSDQDYAGIFRKFEEVGRRAAHALLDQMEGAQMRPSSSGGTDRHGDSAARKRYELGQDRKRAAAFRESERLLREVAALEGPGTAQWAELARDELDYGLPIYEADYVYRSLSARLAEGGPAGEVLDGAEALYRRALDRNRHSQERTLEVQRRLDLVARTRADVAVAMNAMRRGRLASLRVAIVQFAMERGELPSESETVELLALSVPGFELKSYEQRSDRLLLRLGDGSEYPDLRVEARLSGEFSVRSIE